MTLKQKKLSLAALAIVALGILLPTVPHAFSGATPVGPGIVYTCQTSAPAPVGKPRRWIRCSDGAAIDTDASNVDRVASAAASLSIKGDLSAYDGAGHFTRTPVGADGLCLIANSAAASGLSYSACAAGLPAQFFSPNDGVRRVIYARSTGSDSLGDGRTVDTAYRTFQRAVQDVPLLRTLTVYIVDITGIGSESLPPGYALPSWSDLYGHSIRPSTNPLFYQEGGVSIVAQPTVLSTFTAATVTYDAVDTFTTITVAGTPWTTNQYRGRFITDGQIAFNQENLGVVVSNTTNSMLVASFTQYTGTAMQILAPSAELVGGSSDPASNYTAAITIQSASTFIGFFGIKVRSIHPSTPGAFQVHNVGAFWLVLCEVWDDIFVSQAADGFAMQTSFVAQNVGSPLIGYDNSTASIVGCFLQSPGLFGSSGLLRASYTAFVGATRPIGSDEENFPQPSAASFQYCRMTGSTGAFGTGGFYVDGKSSLSFSRLDSNTGPAVLVDGGHLFMTGVVGTGNTGVGVQVIDGGQVHSDGTNTVTGALGNIKVGSRAATTWPGGAANIVDFDTTNGDASRLHQP